MQNDLQIRHFSGITLHAKRVLFLHPNTMIIRKVLVCLFFNTVKNTPFCGLCLCLLRRMTSDKQK